MKPRITFALFLTVCFSACAQQVEHSSTITFDTGYNWLPQYYIESGGPTLNITYELRLVPFFALEVGVHNSLTTTYAFLGDGRGVISSGGRITSVPIGFRFILPINQGKVEFFQGNSGAYTWTTNGTNAWFLQTKLGARVALDKRHHYWIGTTAEYAHQFSQTKETTVSLTADFAYRFGGN